MEDERKKQDEEQISRDGIIGIETDDDEEFEDVDEADESDEEEDDEAVDEP